MLVVLMCKFIALTIINILFVRSILSHWELINVVIDIMSSGIDIFATNFCLITYQVVICIIAVSAKKNAGSVT